jgi:Cu(I)/Ag(I) efflux system membrane fusion protein
MNRTRIVMLVLAACAAGIGGTGVRSALAAENAEGPPVLYYQDPDGRPDFSDAPKSTADGRPYRAVRQGEDISVEPVKTPASKEASGGEKKIRFYRNPMGLPDISKTPKKDSMGMDYIPVYEGEQEDANTITLTPGKIQRLGVATQKAEMRVLSVPIRAPGTIQLDERRISVVSVRTESFVDTVENVTTGTEVKSGQPLLRIYSPVVASAAADYLVALNGRVSGAGLNGSRQRLLNLAVPEGVLAQIEKTREIPLTFTWSAPRDGVVLERNVVDGQRVMPRDVLFRVADHSVVWAVVDVAERDLAMITQGQKVILKTTALGAREFPGAVALVYPHLDPATRSVRVRIELKNDDLVLRPDMYVEALIDTGTDQRVLAVPDSAVIDSGSRRIVILDRGEGKFSPHTVKIGRSGQGYVEITDGIKDGDNVVTSANFLIDAESNLQSALQSMGSDETSP